jgi:hypothetical protein
MALLKGQQKGGWFYPSLPFGFQVTAVTATKTLSPAECGIIAVTGGAAVTLTLPALANGLWYIIMNKAGQNLTVAAPTVDTLIAFNDAAADSVEFSTGGNLIGGAFLIVCDGTNWMAAALGANTLTVNT